MGIDPPAESVLRSIEMSDTRLARPPAEAGVVPVVQYNQRNATDLLDIEYRVEDSIAVSEERLDEAYRKRSRIETAIGVCKDLGLGTPRVRGRVRFQSHVFIALCLRLAVALTNHERDNNIASPTITL
jgi:hypothetical protein